MDDILQSGYYESPLVQNNVELYVDELMELENKITLYFKNTNKDKIMTQEDEEDCRFFINCRFCEKEITVDKVRDHCHPTGKYRGPALQSCNITVTQKQGNFIPFVFHKVSNYECHLL